MNKLFQARVEENKRLAHNHYLITLHPLRKISKPCPGQFFMVSAEKGLDPLLRRPFSIHSWKAGDFQLLYRVVGKATDILREKSPGERLDILGPLGNGFPAPARNKKTILVAGGLGIAPLYYLAESLKGSPLLFIGARTKKEVLCLTALRSLGIKPNVATDDGSLGSRGFITERLSGFLHAGGPDMRGYTVFGCGPRPMLGELSRIVLQNRLQGFITLEEHMACGLGACLSCVVQTPAGYQRVCKEGPVFPIGEIHF